MVDEYFELREEKQQILGGQANGYSVSQERIYEVLMKQMDMLENMAKRNNTLVDTILNMKDSGHTKSYRPQPEVEDIFDIVFGGGRK